MRTWIYKGSQKQNTYLYIDKKDCFDKVPETLLKIMGEFSLVVDIELDKHRKLAQANSSDVLKSLQQQGYYLQLPPGDEKPERLC